MTVPDVAEEWGRIYTALLYGLVLAMIIAFTSWAFLRTSRRFKEQLRRKPPTPTPTPDAWSMHTLPDDAESADLPEGEAHED
ncbi:MAG: hypothetical protein GY842_00480 [bacterium]|nr:hypothetical protein [bacterium]